MRDEKSQRPYYAEVHPGDTLPVGVGAARAGVGDATHSRRTTKVDLLVHELAPYRAHLIKRLAQEIPELDLRMLLTTEFGGLPWRDSPLPGVERVLVGVGESIVRKGKVSSWPREWAKGGRMIRLLDARQPDVVVFFGYGDVGHLRVLRWCRRRGVPAFLSADSNVRAERARGLKAVVKSWLVRRVVRSCAAVLPWGTLGAAYYRKYGAPDGRIFLVPHEPDYAQIMQVPAEAVREVRARFRLDPGRSRIVFSGRLAPEKRVDLLLDAFAAVAARRPDWDLLVVGGGPLKHALHARASRDLAGRVVWTGPIPDVATMAALYHCGEVLALPSDFDPWAVVVNEAMAAGLPVVCSDAVGGGADLVRDGVNGRVFPRGDAAALAECLLDVTDFEQLPARRAASRQALSDWRKRHDPVDGFRQALAAIGVPSSRE